MNLRLRKYLWFFVAIPALLVLSACGGDEAESDLGISVGASGPDFTLANAAGGDVSLADLRGRPTLLYFHMAVG